MKKTIIILGILAAVFGFRQTMKAQDIRNTQNSVDSSRRSNLMVDPVTQALQLQIPLGTYAHRNGQIPVGFTYSSKVWQIGSPHNLTCPPRTGLPGTDTNDRFFALYAEDTKAGWSGSLGFPYIDGDSVETYNIGAQPTTTGIESRVARLTLVMPDGSRHELRKDDQIYPHETTFSGKFYATDGSRLVYDKDTGILYLPDGSRFENVVPVVGGPGDMFPGVFQDTHGNRTTYANNQITDSLGRVIPKPWNSSFAAGDQYGATPADINYAMPGFNNQPMNYQMRWRKLSAAGVLSEHESQQTLRYKGDWTSQACGSMPGNTDALFDSTLTPTGNHQMNRGEIFDPVVLHEIELPDGQIYRFKYNIYGEITKIIYPTGAYERFEYESIYGVSGWFDAPINEQANRGVVRRWVSPDGTLASEMIYSYGVNYSSSSSGSRFVTNPDGTRTEYLLYAKPQERLAYGFDNPLYGKIYEQRQYAAGTNGALISRKLTGWIVDGSVVNNQQATVAYKRRDPRVAREISILFEPGATYALAQMTETGYDTHSDAEYFARLNPKQIKNYHYIVLDLATAETATIATLAGLFSPAAVATMVEMDYLYDASYKARNITGLVTETRVKDAGGNVKAKSQIIYDEAGYLETASITNAPGWTNPNTSYRGLPTTAKSWTDISTNQFIETHILYDQFGNPRKSWDGKGNFTEVQYADNYTDSVNRNGYALPTKTISYAGANGSGTMFESSVKYDFNTGLPRYSIDANNQTSEIQYNDLLFRPTKTIAPNGQQTISEYGVPDSSGTLPASQRFVKIKTQIDEQNWKEGYSWFDGLGRTIKSQSVDASGDVFALTCYDQYGRLEKASNPFRNVPNPTCASTSLEWTTNIYDAVGRVWKVTTPDGAVVETNYGLATSGNNIGTVVTVKDQAMKERRSVTNGLGQLTRVDEPDVNNSNQLGAVDTPSQPTYYEYDILSNLTMVKQGGTFSNPQQTRTFVYDSLSRLKSATNPESGTISYSYDNNGNLTTKTDARDVITNYVYDALNRVTQRSYTNEPTGQTATPTVNYTYENTSITSLKGVMTKVTNGFSTTEYQVFDTLGRVTQSRQWVDGTSYGEPMTYSYNLSGALIEQKYPSGRVVKNVLDNDGDLAIVESKKSASDIYRTYANSFTYTAAGAVSSVRLGNGKFENTQFNSRLQPVQIGLGSSATDQNLLKLNFDYGTINNNGNVLSQTIVVPTVGATAGFTATQAYTYDSLNRLKSAEETIPNQTGWKQTFKYDRYGNRNFDTTNVGDTTTIPAGCAVAVCNPQVDPATNKLVGYQFDDAGNTKVDANGWQFIYDGENKQTEVKDQYGVSKGKYFYDGDGKRVKKISATETTIFVYNAGGQLVAEYSTQISQQPQVSYLTSDHLGSPRINTDQNGAVTARHDYQPFGEEIQRTSYGADTVRKQFTSYERDTETNLDYAKARYHNSSVGRFQSPDPLLSSGKVEDAQSWNRYTYVRNNPLIYTDPLGLFIWSEALGGDAETEDLEAERERNKGLKKQTKDKNERKRLQNEIDRLGKIVDRRKAFIAGMEKARKAANNLSGNERNRVNAALDEYGDENVDNGVTVALGNETQSGQGLAGIEDGRVIVAFRPDEFASDTLFFTIAHEGRHITDAWTNLFGGADGSSPHNVTSRGTEYNAYMITFLTAKGGNYSNTVNVGGVAIYKKGWTKVDIEAFEKGLTGIGRGPNSQAGRNPANWDVRGLWR